MISRIYTWNCFVTHIFEFDIHEEMIISELRCAISVFAQYLKECYQKFNVSFGIFQNKDAIKIITIMYFSMEFGVHMDQDFSANCIYMAILRSCSKEP